MKIGKKSLKMSSGKIKHFGSEQKRDNFEKVARAYKHGWGGPPAKGCPEEHARPAPAL